VTRTTKRILKTVVSVALLLVAATMVAYKFAGGIYYDKGVAAQAALYSVTTQLEIYHQLNGFYPTDEQGLKALVVGPTSSPVPEHWQQLVFFSTLLDPWHRRLVYRFPSPHDPMTFDLFSLGPDGMESPDDIRVRR
jgi:general secretion pathway protein G